MAQMQAAIAVRDPPGSSFLRDVALLRAGDTWGESALLGAERQPATIVVRSVQLCALAVDVRTLEHALRLRQSRFQDASSGSTGVDVDCTAAAAVPAAAAAAAATIMQPAGVPPLITSTRPIQLHKCTEVRSYSQLQQQRQQRQCQQEEQCQPRQHCQHARQQKHQQHLPPPQRACTASEVTNKISSILLTATAAAGLPRRREGQGVGSVSASCMT